MNIEQLAERAFPGPSPAAFLQRQAVAAIVRAAEAQERAGALLRKVGREAWDQLPRLWIRPLPLEVWLAIAAAQHASAARECQDAAEAIAESRKENELAMLAERALERHERTAARA